MQLLKKKIKASVSTFRDPRGHWFPHSCPDKPLINPASWRKETRLPFPQKDALHVLGSLKRLFSGFPHWCFISAFIRPQRLLIALPYF